MDAALLNSLLHQSESETLDFKRDQYPFEGADHNAKSELLKDILALANAWKSSDGHILIGVAEKTGGKADVVGISDHLEAADLQQFVNQKTNRPLSFSYSVATIEGKQLGVIAVSASQARPVFLTRDFGKLRKNVVYIRRGSSTDEASPDESAEMRPERASVTTPPSIEFEFADPDRRERFGQVVTVMSTVLIDPPPPPPLPPQYLLERTGPDIATMSWLAAKYIRDNQGDPGISEPWRGPRQTPEDTRARGQVLALHSGVGFWVRNSGTVTAHDVWIEIHGQHVEGLSQLDEASHPKNESSLGLGASIPSVLSATVNVADHGDGWTVTVDVGKLQPKSVLWVSDRWYVGSRSPLEVDATARIFADNLPEPIVVPLAVKIGVTEREYHPDEFQEDDAE